MSNFEDKVCAFTIRNCKNEFNMFSKLFSKNEFQI